MSFFLALPFSSSGLFSYLLLHYYFIAPLIFLYTTGSAACSLKISVAHLLLTLCDLSFQILQSLFKDYTFTHKHFSEVQGLLVPRKQTVVFFYCQKTEATSVPTYHLFLAASLNSNWRKVCPERLWKYFPVQRFYPNLSKFTQISSRERRV